MEEQVVVMSVQRLYSARCLLGAAVLLCAVPATLADAQEMRARGVVRPNAQAEISSELVAKITGMPFAPGESFKKGDQLVTFDCSRYQAELKASEAAVNSERTLLKQARVLRKHRAGGQTAVNVAVAKVNRAEAEKDALEVTLKQCVIDAPFDGRVVSWSANEHERPPANKPILTIVDDSSLEVELLVPSKWLRWLNDGGRFQFVVDETGKSYGMKIKQIGAVVDPVSQRIMIKAVFPQDARGILPGMSGSARFDAGDG